ncbi:MAG: hypothetical protein Q4A30_01395 [Candidatus Saccharibacteria bacterium]|nr:hypothetical protein [Candidatus Saccharibacteria bacterium]
MEPDSTNPDGQDGVANLIAILRLFEQIQTSKENFEKNSESGEYNDGIIVTY